MGVKKSTRTDVVYAESGRFPLFYHRMFPLIKSWLKLLDSNWSIQYNHQKSKKMILYCNISCVEDECHFILVCTLFDNFRKKYIKSNFSRSSENLKIINNLGKYKSYK